MNSPLLRPQSLSATAGLLGLCLFIPLLVAAATPPPREREETVTETVYVWWLVPWKEPASVACEIWVTHPDRPKPEEVFQACGWDRYLEWISTPVCQAALTGGDFTTCEGLYLYYVGTKTVTRTVTRRYPKPRVALFLEDCAPEFPYMRCPAPLRVRFQGEDPLPEARIERITVQVVGKAKKVVCPGDACAVTLEVPASAAAARFTLRFSAASSWGDTSPTFEARIRAIPEGDSLRVNVLSPQWQEAGWDACALAWEAMPPAATPLPAWLTTPSDPAGLATEVPYYHLAGRLIQHGLVDAATCPNGGLLPNGAANTCGMEKALDLVLAWQNRFDEDIWSAAWRVGIPAVLFKRLIAHESQFWPGTYPERREVGFGHLTLPVLDTLLLWEPEVYWPLCERLLGAWNCRPYGQMPPERRQMLYQYLWVQANLACPMCPESLALERQGEVVTLFAHLLRAKCRQVGQTVQNITRRKPGYAASYVDLWRFTVANYYHPDCLYEGLRRTWKARRPLTWNNVREAMPAGCESTVQYVEAMAP